MADHVSHEESIKKVYKGLLLLGAVTLIEVFISLAGKGHISFLKGLIEYKWFLYLVALGLIVFSLYKAYFIIYEFMHMRYEAKALGMTVLLPMLLLVWAIVAFFQEGNAWGTARADYKEQRAVEINEGIRPVNTKAKEVKINEVHTPHNSGH